MNLFNYRSAIRRKISGGGGIFILLMLATGQVLAQSIIGKTKCDGIQNQMRLFGGRVSPKRKATKISHTHTKKHRSNGF